MSIVRRQFRVFSSKKLMIRLSRNASYNPESSIGLANAKHIESHITVSQTTQKPAKIMASGAKTHDMS